MKRSETKPRRTCRTRTCKSCQRRQSRHEFYVPDDGVCKGCRQYDSMTKGAKKRMILAEIRKDEFLDWYSTADKRLCCYCGQSEEELVERRIKHGRGLVQVMGMDRLDPRGNYAFANMRFCCWPCNRIKSNFFTEGEMKRLGVIVAAIWESRNQRLKTQELKLSQQRLLEKNLPEPPKRKRGRPKKNIILETIL